MGYFEDFEKALSKGFVFVLVIGTTDTSLIPGITIAGANPELTHYTPAADAEYLVLGKCRVIPTVPMTPDGKPTPALITRAALRLAGAGSIVVNAGAKVKPSIPYVELGGEPGGDIRRGRALNYRVIERIVNNGLVLGESLGRISPSLVIGESIPGGTTTAMAFLVAMGYDAWGKMSSASPVNPRELKIAVVKETLRNAGINEPVTDPLAASSKVGDPVVPAMASIAIGAVRAGAKVLLAGGTQMGAVLAFIKSFSGDALGSIAIGTTRWLVNDKTADLLGLVKEVAQVPVVSADLDFSDMPYDGLRAYVEGRKERGT
ncbi:nicotinate mononucleotide-dependent phosphoribosyltransferase CobT [Vulcanisaeta thermophila]|uniref:nicotinate mononucleotide-dependent phosphoribosyltransferase CobT n=1 Tax=Vulcanisaeta thermophila TaxID=867917 RepID=UPI000AFA183E|nr:TIGR00303 family protein [Vulcanisaeta thermophila]